MNRAPLLLSLALLACASPQEQLDEAEGQVASNPNAAAQSLDELLQSGDLDASQTTRANLARARADLELGNLDAAESRLQLLDDDLADKHALLGAADVARARPRDATAHLRRAFERMRQRVGPEDVFVFFYSGHGQQDEVRNEQLDPRIEPDLREDYLQLYDGMVGDDTLAGWLHGIDSHLVICCLDCCFSGGFARDVVSRPNVLGLFSSEEDLTSAVAEGFQAGGYLSVFFREALTGLADQNGDGQIHVGELCHFLQSEFAENVSAEKAITTGGHSAWQHLVVERGGVTVQTPLVER